MFSGNDTIDYPTQWALNPSAYQNMSNDQVDWGALAQQWIHMKETCPAQSVPPAPPPPPPIAVLPSNAGVEGGEAPMEMEGEVEAPPAPSVTQQQWTNASSNPPVSNSSSWDNQSWDTWGHWGWQQNSEPVTKRPLLPEPTYSGYSTGENNFSGYSSGGQSSSNYGNTGYWSGDRGVDGGSRGIRPPHSHPPPPPSSRHPQQMARRNQRPPLLAHPQQEMIEGPDTTQTIDAAKRRQLPAWIREGLEKMEREKQKQMDREREKKERDEFLRLKKIEDEKLLKNAQPDDGIPRPPAKSKFDSDSEESETEDKVKIEKSDREKEVVLPPLLKRSDEEIMQDVMLCVRRTLTEILLDVTTEQILSICQEEVGRIRSQTQATRGASLAGKSQALSAIGGQLGLGIYGDSSGESESETDSTGRSTPGGKKRSSSHDVTDGQLQENIRRRKSEFEKTSREIEARLAAEEEALQRKSSIGRLKTGNSVLTPRDGDDSSGSDGEDTPTENRNEPSVAVQRDLLDKTPLVEQHDKNKRNVPEAKIRHSTEKKERNDTSKISSSSKRNRRSEGKKNVDKSASREKKRRDKSNSSSSSSESSDTSESESVNNKSDDSTSKQSNSVDSVSSESSSSSSSHSSSSPPRKKGKKKKKRTSSDESSKKDRRQSSHKSKSNNGKRSKDPKNATKAYSKFDVDEDTTQSSSKRNRDYYEHKSERSLRDSQFSSRDSYARTPERKAAAKSRYDRSRSRSTDRTSSHRYESKKYSSYRNERRSRDRSREDRGRSRDREYRDRSREYRDSRDRRGEV